MDLLSLDSVHVAFDPPLWREPKRKKRSVFLTLRDGTILTGVTVHHLPAGRRQVEIPERLTLSWPPERRENPFHLNEVQRDLLRMLVREALRPGREAA